MGSVKKLGLIGGMSWVSTRSYYEQINRLVQRRISPTASAPMLIESLDFAQLARVREDADWDRVGNVLSQSARRLEQAGAQAIVIGANSMHKVYRTVCEAVDVPVIHIAECVGERMKRDGRTDATLIGTRNVMTEPFYRRRLEAHGVALTEPDLKNVEMIDRIIYNELMVGKVTRDAQRDLRTVLTRKQQEGVQAIVLACTELALVVDVDANILPIYDSTRIHCAAAVDWMLGESDLSQFN